MIKPSLTKLRISAAVLALAAAGYAGSTLAQQTAPTTDPSAQTSQSAPSSTTAPSYGTDTAAPQADSAASSGTPSSATAAEPTDSAAPAASARPEKKVKKQHKPASAAGATSEAPKP